MVGRWAPPSLLVVAAAGWVAGRRGLAQSTWSARLILEFLTAAQPAPERPLEALFCPLDHDRCELAKPICFKKAEDERADEMIRFDGQMNKKLS
jgi:hypothetical protein